jgi:quinol monooxygenase YgiN
MYGMNGKFVVQEGKRDQLAEILSQAAVMVGQMPGCHLYIVGEDLADQITLWVTEIWDDQETHETSLRDERVRLLIQQAMPLLASPPVGSELKVIGGHGLAKRLVTG